MSDGERLRAPEMVESTGMTWSLKTSFLHYIAQMPDGRVSATDGAAVTKESTFHFTFLDASEKQVRFLGDVRFAGHHGFLFVCIADPNVDIEFGSATLTVQQPATANEEAERIALATAHLELVLETESEVVYSATSVALTDDGSEIFAGVYKPGEALDDFTLRIPRGAGLP